ncbi:MAG TPA: Rieske (2Fe-2S) protein [Stellaceae bacterium]|nr:Rieske (2Fe-2S) protein [Stellaceae bacterium]
MAQRHVVAKLGEIAPGTSKLVAVAGREVGIFNLDGAFYAILSKCPHEGASLCKGKIVRRVESDEPGRYRVVPGSEMIRCPWHGWQYDIRTGRSWCDPDNIALRQYAVEVESGERILAGPYVAETYPVSVEESYLVVEI